MDYYKRIFDESPAPMYIYDFETYRFLAVNDSALHQYDYSRDEFLSMTAKQIRPDDEIDAFTIASGSTAKKYVDFGRWRHKKKNGDTFFVHIYSHFIEFNGRKAKSVVALDIDQKVKAEQAVQEKKKEIEIIFDSITDCFFGMNKDWKLTSVNKECERIFRLPKDQLLGKIIWEFFPESKDLKFFSEFSRAIENQTSVQFEEYAPGYDTWLSVSAYPANEGLAVYFIDITGQKKLREEIFKNEQNVRAIINNTRDLIWSVDAEGNIISGNQPFWERIEVMTGKRPEKIVEEDYDPALYERWQQLLQRAFTGEAFKIVRRDNIHGKEIIEALSSNPIFNDENKVVGVSCFSRDITEQFLYVEMIEKQNEQLRQIAWVQSHEVRAPVASILGLVELFNCENYSDPVNEQVIKMICEATTKLDQVIIKTTSYTSETKLPR